MFVLPFSELTHEQLLQLAQEKMQAIDGNWQHYIGKFLADWLNSNVSEIELHTSGSTGAPRPVKHTKAAMLASARLTSEALELSSHNNALLCLPANKVGGMMMIVRSYYLRTNLYCVPPSIHPFQELPSTCDIDFAAFTPMQVTHMMNDQQAWKKFASISKILLGGEAVAPELSTRLSTLNNAVYSTFGMTETISHIALKKLSGKNPDNHYRTLPGVQVSSTDQGCLVIHAPAIGVPHLLTNDVVRIINDTEFEWKGRMDNVINSGGVKLQAETIEAKLAAHLPVPFFVTAAPDPLRGEKPVLVVQSEALPAEVLYEIKTQIHQLPKWEQPQEILVVTEFLKTDTGKVKRKATWRLALQNTTKD